MQFSAIEQKCFVAVFYSSTPYWTQENIVDQCFALVSEVSEKVVYQWQYLCWNILQISFCAQWVFCYSDGKNNLIQYQNVSKYFYVIEKEKPF